MHAILNALYAALVVAATLYAVLLPTRHRFGARALPRPIGFTRAGRPIYPIAGGAGPTTTTSMTDSVYAKALEATIQEELRPNNVIDALVRKQEGSVSSLVFRFTRLPDPGLTDVQSYTEGTTDLTGTLHQVTTTGADATAAIKGIAGFVSDEVKEVSILDVEDVVSAQFARSMLEQYETDVIGAASPSGFTNIVGDTTNAMSMSRWLTTISALEQADNHAEMAGVLHSKPVGELRQDIASSGAEFIGATGAGASVTELLMSQFEGRLGAPMGIPLYMTNVVPTSDASAGRAGFILAVNSALGVYEVWRERPEIQRVAGKIGDNVVLSSFYGAAVIDVARAELIKTKA